MAAIETIVVPDTMLWGAHGMSPAALQWRVQLSRLNFFHPRRPSLARGVLLALGAMAVSLRLAGFPQAEAFRPSPWQVLLAPVVLLAMFDTARCLRRRWSFYHAGVLLLLYAELMILALVLFLWLYL